MTPSAEVPYSASRLQLQVADTHGSYGHRSRGQRDFCLSVMTMLAVHISSWRHTADRVDVRGTVGVGKEQWGRQPNVQFLTLLFLGRIQLSSYEMISINKAPLIKAACLSVPAYLFPHPQSEDLNSYTTLAPHIVTIHYSAYKLEAP